MTLNSKRWNALLERLSIPRETSTLTELNEHYAQRHRKYHNDAHIADCLQQLDQSPAVAQYPDEVELAIWFHDVIYEPKRTDNEAKSAEWAVSFLRKHRIDESVSERVDSNIRATTHNQILQRIDELLIVDIDLCILGRPQEEYDQFESKIRQEYDWVPQFIFRRKRTAILRSFLDRARIYSTDWFAAEFEDQARQNLKRAIQILQQ